MSLRTDPKYPVRRAWVVKLSSDASPESLCGLLENLVSGQHRHFTSAGELLRLIASDLVFGDKTLLDELPSAELLRLEERDRNVGAALSPGLCLENIREEERTRIARELHDEMGQRLTVLRLDTALMEIRFAPQSDELAGMLAALKNGIDASTAALRDVVASLRPVALDAGLVSAARLLLSGFEERTSIRSSLIVDGVDGMLDDPRTTAAFRILQESLINVVRHANADQLAVRISFDVAELRLCILDNGAGFDVGAVRQDRSFGLLGMRERVAILGGTTVIESAPGKGTRISVTIPSTGTSSAGETRE